MIEELKEMQLIGNRRVALAAREKELSVPLLKDLSKLDEIYGWFNEIEATHNSPSVTDTSTQRKKFMLIALSLYSPGALTGRRMVKGLRNKLTSLFSLHAQTAISNSCYDLLFIYENYKNFQKETDQTYQAIQNRLIDSQI